MKFISLFSGAGGLDIGLEAAGWRCAFATDVDPAAVETLMANAGRKSDTVIQQRDIRTLKGREILDTVGVSRGDVPLLAGGPPCQSWSSAGHQLGFDDPRGRLFDDYLRVARDLDVRWLLFENVRGLVTARGRDGRPGSALAAIRDALFRAGWQTRVELLNAADYGVPQRRVRLILVGYRAGDPPPLPHATHTKDGADGRRWRTLGECLSEIAPPTDDEIIRPSGKLAEELAALRPGSGVKSPGKRETTRPGGHWGYKQGAFVADLERPARTVTANAQQDWIIDKKLGLRRLSPRECAAVQTFPADWRFVGKRTDQYRLVGNAVPPLLAEQIGLALLKHIKRSATIGEVKVAALAPLPLKLQAAVDYTLREELRNGESRRSAPARRRVLIG
jgi:DNA (cytosine-5)-methyltransferase 1